MIVMQETGGIIIRVSSLSKYYREELCRRLEKALNSSEIGFVRMHSENSSAEEAKYIVNNLPPGHRGFLPNPGGFYDYFG